MVLRRAVVGGAAPTRSPRRGAKISLVEIAGEQALIDAVLALGAGAQLLARLPEDLVPAVYLVGGSVRDLLLGRVPIDLDLVVEAPAGALARRLGTPLSSHDRFGTVTILLDGVACDIATSRRERYAHPGALPEVEPAPLREDLLRRDFTVNALALALTGPERGLLRSAPSAREDLEARRLRVLHDASFIDDPTRLLRLARYQTRLRFAIEPHTVALARSAVDLAALATVSGSRVGNELRLVAREHEPLAALLGLRELGIDEAIAPGFGIDDPELAQRAFELLPEDGDPGVLALALAARGLSAPDLRALLDELAFQSRERDEILAAATRSEALADRLRHARRPSEIAAAVGVGSPELVALAGALGPAGPAHAWLTSLRHVELQIDGNDLLSAGVSPGPPVGLGLRVALAAALDGRAEGREQQLREALRVARSDG